MISQTAETDTVNAATPATTAIVAAIEVFHFRQQLVVLVVRSALSVEPMTLVRVIVVAIRGLVTEPAKLFVFALHETHRLTARAPLQKELGPTKWTRDLRLRPVARVPRRRRRVVHVQVLCEGVHRFVVLVGGVILREHEHPTAALRGLVAVHRDFAGGLAVGANRVNAALGFGVALLDC